MLGSNSSSGIRDLKSATHGSALRKSHLVCATSLDFYSSQMLKDFCFSDCKCANDVCVYDLDTFTVSDAYCRTHCDTILYSIRSAMLRNAVPNCSTLYFAILRYEYIIPYTTPYYTMLYYNIPYRIILNYIIPYYATLY